MRQTGFSNPNNAKSPITDSQTAPSNHLDSPSEPRPKTEHYTSHLPKNGARPRYPIYAIPWSLSRLRNNTHADCGIKKTRYCGLSRDLPQKAGRPRYQENSIPRSLRPERNNMNLKTLKPRNHYLNPRNQSKITETVTYIINS